jgi:hypothetical protein
VTDPRTAEEWVALLRTRIDASGLSVERYATTVLIREGTTVRAWLRGERPIPGKVRDWLVRET